MKKILLMSIVGIFMVLGTLAFVINPVAAESQDPCTLNCVSQCNFGYQACILEGGGYEDCQAEYQDCLYGMYGCNCPESMPPLHK